MQSNVVILEKMNYISLEWYYSPLKITFQEIHTLNYPGKKELKQLYKNR